MTYSSITNSTDASSNFSISCLSTAASKFMQIIRFSSYLLQIACDSCKNDICLERPPGLFVREFQK